MQVVLSKDSIIEFYHDQFVTDQVKSFTVLLDREIAHGNVVVDVGGGYGYFAKAIRDGLGASVRVIDSDVQSVEHCRRNGLDAEIGDALAISPRGDEAIVCFNLILHHLVGRSARDTRSMQTKAISDWNSSSAKVFVNEYIYESPGIDGISAWLIWAVTSSKVLSLAGRAISTIVPSLRANTFGVGVRFRTAGQWIALFRSAGYEVVGHSRGQDEPVSLARKVLLIKHCRRDSFLLRRRIEARGISHE
jgi:hypothetical protein